MEGGALRGLPALEPLFVGSRGLEGPRFENGDLVAEAKTTVVLLEGSGQ